jgi:hypothetical protein
MTGSFERTNQMGVYRRSHIDVVTGRPIYEMHGRQFLYYKKELQRWQVGTSYSNNAYTRGQTWIYSKSGEASTCPSHASMWHAVGTSRTVPKGFIPPEMGIEVVGKDLALCVAGYCANTYYLENIDWKYQTRNVTTFEDCQDACNNTPTCSGFEWPNGAHYCIFWSHGSCGVDNGLSNAGWQVSPDHVTCNKKHD